VTLLLRLGSSGYQPLSLSAPDIVDRPLGGFMGSCSQFCMGLKPPLHPRHSRRVFLNSKPIWSSESATSGTNRQKCLQIIRTCCWFYKHEWAVWILLSHNMTAGLPASDDGSNSDLRHSHTTSLWNPTRIRTGRERNRGSILGEGIISFSTAFRPATGAHPA
jgi:hypothetical protein